MPPGRVPGVGSDLDLLRRCVVAIPAAAILSWIALASLDAVQLVSVPAAAHLAWGALCAWTSAGVAIVLQVAHTKPEPGRPPPPQPATSQMQKRVAHGDGTQESACAGQPLAWDGGPNHSECPNTVTSKWGL